MRCRVFYCLMFTLGTCIAMGQVSVDFDASVREGCGSLQTQFTDLSSSEDGAIVEWLWELDEGLISEVAAPGRVFTDPGSYDICLTVTDIDGNSARRCKEGYVVVYNLPRVEFAADPVTGCSPLNVTFENLTTSDNPVKRLIWDLGGEAGVRIGGGELNIVEVTYTEPQDYGVSLTVEDEKGCISSLAKPGMIRVGTLNRPDITVVNPLGCDAPHSTGIEVQGLDPGVLYSWDFDNAQTYEGYQPPPQVFNDEGTYSLTLYARDSASACRDTFVYANYVNVGLASAPTVSLDSGCVGTAFRFSDPAISGGESVHWDFGDGNTSSKPLSNHAYDSAGCYTVTLTKTFAGCENIAQLEQCVQVVERPVIELATEQRATCEIPGEIHLEVTSPDLDGMKWYVGDSDDPVIGKEVDIRSNQAQTIPFVFSGRYLPGCSVTYEDSVYFGPMEIDLPTLAPAGCIPASARMRPVTTNGFLLSSWDWTLMTDPPRQSFLERPTFDVEEAGTFDVNLIAMSEEGCVDSLYVADYVSAGTPPQVSITSDILSTCADTAIQFSTDFTSPVTEVFWDFGDGGESDELNPSHSFLDTGDFTVVLISSYNGCTSIDSLSNVINILGPVARFGARVVCGTLDLELRDASKAADEVRYEVTQNGIVIQASNLPDVNLTLPADGEYEVIQYAENVSNGCVDEHRDSVFAGPVQIAIEAFPQSGCAPLDVSLLSQAKNVESWQWFVPGGQITDDTVVSPLVKFAKAGSYTSAEVVITDGNGCTTEHLLDLEVLVGAAEPEIADTTYFGCPESDIELRIMEDPPVPVVDWVWTFSPGALNSNAPNPVFTSPNPGFFNVALEVTDSLGCTSSASSDSLIHILDKNLDFLGDTLTCAQINTVFRVIEPLDGLIYTWYKDDSIMHTGNRWQFRFDTIGSYEVCLSVEGIEGCDSIKCKSVTVTRPRASFHVDTSYSSCPPLLVNFLNDSEFATSFEWYFGDNSGRSALDSPLHVYTAPGSYDVTLIASLSENCSDTLLMEELIELEGPVGNFNYLSMDACLPVQVTFNGQSEDQYAYVWDFGNGVLDSTEVRVVSDTTSFTYVTRGSYLPRLILIDTLNCRRALSGVDTIHVQGEFLEAGPDRDICAGETIQLLPEVLAGDVTWQGHPFIPDTNQLDHTLEPDSSAVLVISGYEGSCFESDTVYINVEKAVTIDVTDTRICYGDTAEVIATGDADTYEWLNSEGLPLQYGGEQSIRLGPDTTSVFTVIGYRSVCKPDTVQVEVGVFGNFDYFLPRKAIVYKGEQYRLPMQIADGQADISWRPAEFVDCRDCPSPYLLADSSLTMYVTLTEPVLGCMMQDSIDLRFPGSCTGEFAFIPNVFSPNGDGANDVLTLETEKYASPIEFSVFDRWGNRVYNTRDKDFTWDGRRRGELLSPGVYVYRLMLTCPIDDAPVVVTGDITLVR